MKKMIMLLVCVFTMTLSTMNVQAAPYETYTKGSGSEAVETQTAYEPTQILKVEANAPEDLYFDDISGHLYIADTQNARILDYYDGKLNEINYDGFMTPTGIYVRNDKMYVADSGARKVFIFQNNQCILEIERPDEPLFGQDTPFVPKKVAADARGNIYVIAEGSSNGIIHLNRDGDFLGYIGSNQTTLSFSAIMKRLFFTQAQKDQLFKNLPPSPTAITMDADSLVYSATYGLVNDAIKKFNAAGSSMLGGRIQDMSQRIVDIDVDKNGNMYSVSDDGTITETDSYGNFLFSFGSQAGQAEVSGLLKNPVAIDTSNSGKLYVLDKDRSLVQIYTPTEFALKVHEGVALYKDGRYLEGEEIWKDVLQMNSSFILSYEALAKAYYKQDLNEQSLEAFQLAEDKNGYSNAFWEIRNEWLQENLGSVMFSLFIFFIIWQIAKYIDKKKHIFAQPKQILHKICDLPILKEIIYLGHVVRHPIDSFYEIRYKNKVTVTGATIMYLLFVVISLAGYYIRGYLFNVQDVHRLNVLFEILKIVLPLGLFVIANYLVATINDGEGRLKDVYTGTIVSFAPYLLFALPMYLLSNVLSLNEAFIYDFGMLIINGYSLLILFMMVKEVHNYSISETIKIIAITVFTAIMLVLLCVCLYVFAKHTFDFIENVVQELRVREI